MKKLYSLILLAFFQVLICNAGLPYSTLEVDSTGLIQNTNVTLTATNTIQQTNTHNQFAGTFISTTNTIICGYGRINWSFGSLPTPYNNVQGSTVPTNSTGIYATHYILPDELQGRTNIQIVTTYLATNSGTGFHPYYHFYGTGPDGVTTFNDTSYNPTLSYVPGFNYFTNTYHLTPNYTNMYICNQVGDSAPAPTNWIWLINVKEIIW